jgi:hypothetical protein
MAAIAVHEFDASPAILVINIGHSASVIAQSILQHDGGQFELSTTHEV